MLTVWSSQENETEERPFPLWDQIKTRQTSRISSFNLLFLIGSLVQVDLCFFADKCIFARTLLIRNWWGSVNELTQLRYLRIPSGRKTALESLMQELAKNQDLRFSHGLNKITNKQVYKYRDDYITKVKILGLSLFKLDFRIRFIGCTALCGLFSYICMHEHL